MLYITEYLKPTDKYNTFYNISMQLPRLKKLKSYIYSNTGAAFFALLFILTLLITSTAEKNDTKKTEVDVVENNTEISAGDNNEINHDIKGSVLAGSNPVSLQIPKINVDTEFEAPLGLFPDGEIEVPDSYTAVGWYENSPTPGELGPAIILGHVDSIAGPAVFYSLGQLEVGDDIYVGRKDGSVAHFQVTLLERYEQVEFPVEKVYGDIDHAGLRLITCSGIFSRGSQRYSHNLVVYAKLVE